MNECIFDLKSALERLGGDRDLYRNLLGLFIVKYGNIETEIKRLADLNEIQKIQCLVHSIKGVAGNLGADALFEDAKMLNTDLKNGNLDTELINEFCEDMKAAIEAAKNLKAEL